MENIGGFGLTVNIFASITYPNGIEITQFADDADPFDMPSIQIRDKASGLNGDLVSWSKATPINVTLNVIAGSDDDKKLALLFENNRAGRLKLPVSDEIAMIGTYPDGSTIDLGPGIITDGLPGSSVASAGRLKSKSYAFSFENKA